MPDRGDECRGADHVHPGNGHQPSDLLPAQGLLGDQLLNRADLCVDERDLAQTRVNGLALL